MTLRVGSLFSGVGLLDLGLERAGLGEPAWFAEIDPYARAVLRRHWPKARLFHDVREVTDAADRVDVVVGGFPCQPISAAGRKLGERDPRWLWPEFARIVAEVRPAIVVAENVPPLRSRGLRSVLADLARLGFDAEWTSFLAGDIGAPHERNRIWIAAWHPDRADCDAPGWLAAAARAAVADAHAQLLRELAERGSSGRPRQLRGRGEAEPAHDGAARALADSDGGRSEPRPDDLRERLAESDARGRGAASCTTPSDAAPERRDEREDGLLARQPWSQGGAWSEEADGSPSDADRLGDARAEGAGRSARSLGVERGGRERETVGVAADADGAGELQPEGRFGELRGWARDSGWRNAPPAVRGVDDGGAEGLDLRCDAPGGCRGEACDHECAPDSFRVAGLGNGVVVQCAELVGRAVVTNVRPRRTVAA